jgi:hypothetical protein
MAYRGPRDSRDTVYQDREAYYSSSGPPPRRRDEDRGYDRRGSSPPRARAPTREYEETEVRVRERSRDSRVPNWMREDGRRPPEAGALVLRQRDIETVERPRPRPRSPSPIRITERDRIVRRERSLSPPPRPPPTVERDRIEVRGRYVERERIRSPSRGASVERIRTRVVERERERSPPSPPSADRIRTRIVERERERVRSPSISSSSSSEPPRVVRGPTIEREVITHYRDIDHGMLTASPSPPSLIS